MKQQVVRVVFAVCLVVIGVMLSAAAVADGFTAVWEAPRYPTATTPGFQLFSNGSDGTQTMQAGFGDNAYPTRVLDVSSVPLYLDPSMGGACIGDQYLYLVSASDVAFSYKVEFRFSNWADVEVTKDFTASASDFFAGTMRFKKTSQDQLVISVENVSVAGGPLEDWLNTNSTSIRDFFNLPKFDLSDREKLIGKANLYETYLPKPPPDYQGPPLPPSLSLFPGYSWMYPEPSSLLALGSGLAGLGGVLFRRRRR